MHPDLHLVVYRQQERELNERLVRALAAHERGVISARRSRNRAWRRLIGLQQALFGSVRARIAPVPTLGVAPACCPA
jgi:hypothetical protein